MTASPTVRIDALPSSVARSRPDEVVVAVDVIRATTTAVTAAVRGRRTFPASSLDDAQALADGLTDPLMVGELGGHMPYDFEVTNSPAAIAQRADVARPMVLLSSSGTQLICAAAKAAPTYVACMRNRSAQSAELIARGRDVVIIGAGTRGVFREEDQLCCAQIAADLIGAGFDPADDGTIAITDRWRDADISAATISDSVRYLKRTDQLADLDFVLTHVDDVDAVFVMDGRELVAADRRGR